MNDNIQDLKDQVLQLKRKVEDLKDMVLEAYQDGYNKRVEEEEREKK